MRAKVGSSCSIVQCCPVAVWFSWPFHYTIVIKHCNEQKLLLLLLLFLAKNYKFVTDMYVRNAISNVFCSRCRRHHSLTTPKYSYLLNSDQDA